VLKVTIKLKVRTSIFLFIPAPQFIRIRVFCKQKFYHSAALLYPAYSSSQEELMIEAIDILSY
jgi:hypothetical protein